MKPVAEYVKLAEDEAKIAKELAGFPAGDTHAALAATYAQLALVSQLEDQEFNRSRGFRPVGYAPDYTPGTAI